MTANATPPCAQCAERLDTIGILVAALDDASSVVDASEGEEYAYQAELEAGRAALAQTAPTIDPDPDVNWNNDAIQFPRLLAELNATVSFSTRQLSDLCASMDLTGEEVMSLFERAVKTWDAIKERTKR